MAKQANKEIWEHKIGLADSDYKQRISNQVKGSAEKPIVPLCIKTNWPGKVEKIIHNILEVRNRYCSNAPNTETFYTSSEEIEEIYRFIIKE